MKNDSENNDKTTRIGILKLGNIASSVLLEMLLDERADRQDIEVRTISSGAKLLKESIEHAYRIFSDINFDLIIIASPNASLPNPMNIILQANEKSVPIIVLSDILKKEHIEELKSKNIGYLVIKSDAMIGARREFLDPTEMAIFNSDLLKVLAIGGVLSFVHQEIDKVITQIRNNEKITLPQIIVTTKKAIENAGFDNPYAESKAFAALEIAQKVASINSEGCFKITDRLEYITQVAMGHEMMRNAAQLADEAREIEKTNNKVRRQPHYYDGEIQDKRLLKEKPSSHYK
ncbi:MAG: F420-dependent methylenetetrahydromethanopterin dehydrogenase [Candidatus Heimdallarchaeota archaeon]|nr:F420-dependent methylenetetrahydromethanopterin dehydrogenase [Candidatus Heimdallarchaeota archaeon]